MKIRSSYLWTLLMIDPASFPTAPPNEASDQSPPQFGLLDIIEAFTAMRHEYRGQAKDGRELAQQVLTSTDQIRQMELSLKSLVACHSTDEAHKFVRLLTELDTQLTRAVDAAIRTETVRQQQQRDQQTALQNIAKSMGPVARWFAGPLLKKIEPATDAVAHDVSSVAEGLSMLLARLRQMLHENEIQRLDTQGLPFDAEVMNSIGTIESKDVPTGHVAQQLAPGYRWRGNLLRVADVRICV